MLAVPMDLSEVLQIATNRAHNTIMVATRTVPEFVAPTGGKENINRIASIHHNVHRIVQECGQIVGACIVRPVQLVSIQCANVSQDLLEHHQTV